MDFRKDAELYFMQNMLAANAQGTEFGKERGGGRGAGGLADGRR
jgi:hypothetical protein